MIVVRPSVHARSYPDTGLGTTFIGAPRTVPRTAHTDPLPLPGVNLPSTGIRPNFDVVGVKHIHGGLHSVLENVQSSTDKY
jgi:hypothetical protein